MSGAGHGKAGGNAHCAAAASPGVAALEALAAACSLQRPWFCVRFTIWPHSSPFTRSCILDYKPRSFSAEQALLLAQLSAMVMREVERKKAMNDALCNAAVRTTGEAVATDRQVRGVYLVTSSPKWPIQLSAARPQHLLAYQLSRS